MPSGLLRYTRLAVRLAVIVGLVFLGYKALRLSWIGWQSYQAGQAILALRADGDLDAADLRQAHQQLQTIEALAATGEREVQFAMPLLTAARPLPWIGPTLAATPNFIAAGHEMLGLATDGLGLLATATDTAGDVPVPQLLAQALTEQPDALANLTAHIAAAQAALDRIDAATLIAPLSTPVDQGQDALALAAVGLQLAPSLPALLGFDGPRTYLLLVQNSQELRATGGFITAVGAVTLDHGDIGGLELTDSYNVTRNDIDHPWAPDPMRRYMGIQLVFLRDANWSPDFPITAQLARALYAQDAGKQVDGVVSIDLHAVQLLVGALGPLEIPGADGPVTGDNIITQLQQFWDRPPTGDATIQTDKRDWLKQRKDFMPLLATSALTRLRAGSFNPLALAAAAKAALDQRAVQVWLPDPIAGQVLNAAGWDGALRPDPDADFVAVVDTNMGYNKVDAVLERGLDYAVQWPDGPDAPAQATLTLLYHHPVQAQDVECVAKSEYGDRYTDMIERCYFDYLRVYVPAGSKLIAAEGLVDDSFTEQPGERGAHIFGGYFILPPDQTHTVTLHYSLPPRLTPAGYRLVVQRQAGSGPLPLMLTAQDATYTDVLVDGRLAWTPGQ